MNKLKVMTAAAWLASIGIAGSAAAHHSFAMFDQSKQMLVEGRVTGWNYNNPHSWLMIEAPDETGKLQTWSFEGAAPVHATRQGVTGQTYQKGERVRVIMSPIKDGRRAGAMCFVVKADASITQPNDGTCNAVQVIERWKAKGWLENGKHLESHPTTD